MGTRGGHHLSVRRADIGELPGHSPGVCTINLLTVGKLLPLLVFCAIGLFHLGVRPQASPVHHRFPATSSAAFDLRLRRIRVRLHSQRRSDRAAAHSAGGDPRLGGVGRGILSGDPVGGDENVAGAGRESGSAGGGRAVVSGPAGGVLLAVGAVLSTTGTNSASILVGSRMLYALGRSGDLPSAFARLHPRYRTPAVSTLLFAAVAWIAALMGSFGELAALGALSRVLYYTATCAAVPVLRAKKAAAAPAFTLPGGWTVPALALGVCAWLLAGSTLRQALITGAAMLAGSVLYAISALTRRSRAA